MGKPVWIWIGELQRASTRTRCETEHEAGRNGWGEGRGHGTGSRVLQVVEDQIHLRPARKKEKEDRSNRIRLGWVELS